jgi:hypothetical protein
MNQQLATILNSSNKYETKSIEDLSTSPPTINTKRNIEKETSPQSQPIHNVNQTEQQSTNNQHSSNKVQSTNNIFSTPSLFKRQQLTFNEQTFSEYATNHPHKIEHKLERKYFNQNQEQYQKMIHIKHEEAINNPNLKITSQNEWRKNNESQWNLAFSVINKQQHPSTFNIRDIEWPELQTNDTAIKDTTSHEYSYLINKATTFILTQPKIELLPEEDSDTEDNYHSSIESDHEDFETNIFNTNETIQEIEPDIPSVTPNNHQETETILIDSIIQQQITNIDKDDPDNHIMLLDFDNQPINQI